MKKSILLASLILILVLAFPSAISSAASQAPQAVPTVGPIPPDQDGGTGMDVSSNGSVTVEGTLYPNFTDYFNSDYFKSTGKRCGTRAPEKNNLDYMSIGDCTTAQTILQAEYWPSQTYTIPVVFHVITKTDGTGNVTDQEIRDQITVLNEDYRAISSTMGASGYDTKIQFTLAGITRTVNNTWFNDENELQYKTALKWDTTRYLNVYTNSASGYLGYSYFPQESAGNVYDGVVALYETVGGRNNGYSPYDQGRTLTHEIGHYMGLYHTFEGGCSNSYTSGDLIMDTPAEAEDHYGCTQTYSCGAADDIRNYMNYTDDSCMEHFTREQANRAVCSLRNYRPYLSSPQTTGLTLTKTITSGRVYSQVGDVIGYQYLLRNSGDVALTGSGSGGRFVVTDDKTTVTCPATPTSLAAGATVTCTASYTVLQADLDRGTVINHAQGFALYETTTVTSNQAIQIAGEKEHFFYIPLVQK